MNLISRKATAEYLGISEATLRKWASTRLVALPFYRVGRAVRYSITDIEEFLRVNRSDGSLK
jgi:excisionase family DNA binding protein